MTREEASGGPPRRTAPWFRTGLIFVALACPCLGLVAFTLPRYVRFAERSRQSECKANLKGWFTAQRSRQEGYALEVATVGFVPERGNRYAYFAGPGPLEDRGGPEARHHPEAVGYGVDLFKFTDTQAITFEHLPPEVASLVGLSGSECPQGPDCIITLACAGNLDRDDTLDVWTISTEERRGPDGDVSMAGEPVLHVDDTRN